MTSIEHTRLRFHIEAVWNIQLPSQLVSDCEPVSTSMQTPWRLCVAVATNTDQIRIWRSDITPQERDALRSQIPNAIDFSLATSGSPDIHREIALALTVPPRLDPTTAQTIARPLTRHDQSLLEAFWNEAVDSSFYLKAHPLIGIVADGRLLCLAHSSRRTKDACELGIETREHARRQGYALAATVLWTQLVKQEGRMPIYSAAASNTASLRLAAAAGYREFARAAIIT